METNVLFKVSDNSILQIFPISLDVVNVFS